MSNLANAIDHLLNKHHKTATDLAVATGLQTSQISRWKNVRQKSIKPLLLQKLALGFSKTPQTHASLLYAHLLDVCTGPGAQYITIAMDGKKPAPATPAAAGIPLAPSVQSDLDTITSAVNTSPQVRELVHSIAKLCRSTPLSQARP